MTPTEIPLLYQALTQGLLIGFVSAAVIGPVNFMVVRRGILNGFQAGFSTGAGAAFMSAICAYAVYSGILRMGFSGYWKILMWGIGVVLILFIGYNVLQEIRDNPEWSEKARVKNQTAFVDHPFVVGLLLVGSNPYSLLYWIAMVSTLNLSNTMPIDPVGRAATGFFSAVFMGAIGWYFMVSWAVHQSRNLFNRKWLTRFSLVTGLGLLFYAGFWTIKVLYHLFTVGGQPVLMR